MSLKKEIWIAPFLREYTDENDNTIQEYDTPFKLNSSLNSLSGDYDFQLFGEKVSKMCKTMINCNDLFEKIHEKDRAYVYGITPTGETLNGDKANFYVKRVLPQNIKMTVYFDKL